MTLEERLEKIERLLCVLVERQQVQKWYSTQEFSRATGKAEFTIREYCRLGRLQAERKVSGRGPHRAYVRKSHRNLDGIAAMDYCLCQRPNGHANF